MTKRQDIDRLQGEIEELFADLWQVPRFSGLRHGFRPQVDCYRTEQPPELTIVVELAGIDPDEVRLVASGRTLVIAGERPRPRVEGQVYQQMEIDYGRFQRQIRLGEDVDSEHARATYEHGLLKIVLPLAQKPTAPVKVPIEVRTRP